MKNRLLKTLVSILMVLALLPSTAGAVTAVPGIDGIRSSDQLDSYSIGLTQAGSGQLKITYDVWGTHPMDCIGAQSIILEEEVAPGKWQESTSYSEQYTYDSITHADVIYVKVFPGTKYRASLTAYARDSRGYDTGTVTSYIVLAR